MKKNIFISFIIISCLFFKIGCGRVSFAQNRNIDSLLNLLKNDKPDTNQVNHLNQLSNEYVNVGEYDAGLKYGNKAQALAKYLPQTYSHSQGKTVQGWAKGIASAYHNIGNIHYYRGNYRVALKNYFAALKIWEVIKNKQGITDSYNNIGNIYTSTADYSKALKNYLLSLKIYEDIGDKQGIAASCINIGAIYQFQGNYPVALKKYLTALKIYEDIYDKQGIATSYNNIAAVYQFQGNYSDALKNYIAVLKIREDSKDKQGIATSHNNIGNIYCYLENYSNAMKSYSTSLKIREAINDKQGIAISYYCIGDIYTSQNKYQEALKNYFASLKINEEIGDKQGIVKSLIGLGRVHTHLKKINEAKKYFDTALNSSIKIGSSENIKNSYLGLAAIDSINGNWMDAYLHHKLFIVYRDSIDNEETRKKTTEIILTNKFEKQEAATKATQDKKDTIATANKKRQQLILILVSCVLIFVFIFAGFVVRSLRITRKQKEMIEHQKDEVSHQKEIVLKKNKEITDSINYAQRIQRALLASNTMLDANLIGSNPGFDSESLPLLKSPKLPKQIRDRQVRDRQVNQDRDYFIFFQPKDIVSGDFYWASILENGNFALVTADSTGHGVPGAIMSMLNISCLNEAVKGQLLTEPNEILNYTRSKIIEHLSNDGSDDGGKDGMDCSLISFEFDSMKMENRKKNPDSPNLTKLTYSAANNPIWIVKSSIPGKPDSNDVSVLKNSSELIELKPDKMPVGKHERDKIPFTQQTIELQKGDIVYTLTDGMPDQFGGSKGKKFMARQLKELIISICHLPMNEQKEKLAAAFNLWKGNLEQVDDVCIIGVKI